MGRVVFVFLAKGIPTQPSQIAGLSACDVSNHSRQVAAAATWPLAKFFAVCRLGSLIQRRPTCLQQRLQALQFGIVDRCSID
jgi:hypothetical protein